MTEEPVPALVHPEAVLRAVQRWIIDATEAPLLVESGNSFAWANQLLSIPREGRYRASMLWGSLGHACAGVLGAALIHGKAVALTGDGAMLFTNEVSTAVSHGIRAVWIVLNDAAYGSCVAGQSARGLSSHALGIPRVDFVAYARSVGADGVAVRSESDLEPALKRAMLADIPFVVDVPVSSEPSPLAQRFDAFFGSDEPSHYRLRRSSPRFKP